MTPKQEAPREWTIPAGVGSYYDSKEVHFAVGPLLDLTQELSVTVIEKSAYDRVERMYLEMRDGHEHVLHKLAAEEKELREQLATVTAERDAVLKQVFEVADPMIEKLRAENFALSQLCSKRKDEHERCANELSHARAELEQANEILHDQNIHPAIKERDEARAECERLKVKVQEYVRDTSDSFYERLDAKREERIARYTKALERIANDALDSFKCGEISREALK